VNSLNWNDIVLIVWGLWASAMWWHWQKKTETLEALIKKERREHDREIIKIARRQKT